MTALKRILNITHQVGHLNLIERVGILSCPFFVMLRHALHCEADQNLTQIHGIISPITVGLVSVAIFAITRFFNTLSSWEENRYCPVFVFLTNILKCIIEKQTLCASRLEPLLNISYIIAYGKLIRFTKRDRNKT